uniref:ATP-dependent RNA helicase n=1 Tax=Lygus hesperus TaxID=30085 RepID=A0A0A9ZEY0_LYGHE
MSRGFDVKDLLLVINYSVPYYYEDYVHRVGRTGRATSHGTAITFITPEEEEYSIDLVKALTLSKQVIPETLLEIKRSFDKKVENKEAVYYRNRGFHRASGFTFDEQESTKSLYSLLSKEHSTYDGDVDDI